MQQEPDLTQLLKLARSPEGQQLMTLLRSGGADPAEAARLAAQGDWDQARQRLSSLLSTPECQALLRQLEQQL